MANPLHPGGEDSVVLSAVARTSAQATVARHGRPTRGQSSLPQAARRPSSSRRMAAVILEARLVAAATANTTLYASTRGKLASHSMRPKSPSRSKLVMPAPRPRARWLHPSYLQKQADGDKNYRTEDAVLRKILNANKIQMAQICFGMEFVRPKSRTAQKA